MARTTPKNIPYAARLDAVRRVRIGGEVALQVAKSVGVDPRQIYRWEKDEGIRRELSLDKVEMPPQPPEDTPIVTELEMKRLLEAVRGGLAPERAMRQIGRPPGAWRIWLERAPKDEQIKRLVDAVERADSDCELDAVRSVRKGGMGWQGPAWWLERRLPRVYSQQAANEAQAADTYSTEELLAVVQAAGLLEGFA